MKQLNGARNQCQTCKEYFNSNRAFDKHRTGAYGLNRRCLSPEEMQSKGMVLRKDGFWITKPMPENLALLYQGNKNENQHA